MYRAYILSKSARSPRFRTERENWVQRVVADGHAICILPERSAAAPGLVTRPIEGLFGAGIGDRDGLGIDHSGRDTEDRATRLDVRMAVRTVAAVPPPLWKLYSQRIGKLRPALRCEDYASILRDNSNSLGSQTKYWRLIMQYDSEVVCSSRGVAPGEQ